MTRLLIRVFFLYICFASKCQKIYISSAANLPVLYSVEITHPTPQPHTYTHTYTHIYIYIYIYIHIYNKIICLFFTSFSRQAQIYIAQLLFAFHGKAILIWPPFFARVIAQELAATHVNARKNECSCVLIIQKSHTCKYAES